MIAESFERIHRSNLVGMGVLPLQINGNHLKKNQFHGKEIFNIGKLRDYLQKPNIEKKLEVKKLNGEKIYLDVISRIDTEKEIRYFESNGILPYVLNNI